MKTRKYAIVAAALTLGIAMLVSPGAQAQPLDDRVIVNMPYTTTIGHKVLPPGEYVIQRMHSASGSRVLLIYSDNGMKFETSALTIPCLDPNVARDTKVILSRLGDDYYYDKVWVQGKEYGYEFILPKEARMRRKEMARVTVPASTSSSTITTTTTSEQPAELAQVEGEQQVENNVEQQANVEEQAKVEEQTYVETPVEEPAVIAEAETPAEEQLPESAAREEVPPPAPSAAERTSMPKTNTGWMTLLFGGGTLLGAGFLLRKR